MAKKKTDEAVIREDVEAVEPKKAKSAKKGFDADDAYSRYIHGETVNSIAESENATNQEVVAAINAIEAKRK